MVRDPEQSHRRAVEMIRSKNFEIPVPASSKCSVAIRDSIMTALSTPGHDNKISKVLRREGRAERAASQPGLPMARDVIPMTIFSCAKGRKQKRAVSHQVPGVAYGTERAKLNQISMGRQNNRKRPPCQNLDRESSEAVDSNTLGPESSGHSRQFWPLGKTPRRWLAPTLTKSGEQICQESPNWDVLVFHLTFGPALAALQCRHV